MQKRTLKTIQMATLCFVLACTNLWASTTTFRTSINTFYGKEATVKKLIITVTPEANDVNSISSTATLDEPNSIYGVLRRITLKASGTDTAFSVIIKDEDSVMLFEKTDCNTAQMPLSYSLFTVDVDDFPQEDIVIAGPLTFETGNVDPNNLTSITIILYYQDFRQ